MNQRELTWNQPKGGQLKFPWGTKPVFHVSVEFVTDCTSGHGSNSSVSSKDLALFVYIYPVC